MNFLVEVLIFNCLQFSFTPYIYWRYGHMSFTRHLGLEIKILNAVNCPLRLLE